MARSVTRVGIPSRFTNNPNVVASQEYLPGPGIPLAALATPQSTQPMNPSVPQSLNINNSQIVKTPYGSVFISYMNGQASGISKNVIFQLPINRTQNNYTITGSITYNNSQAYVINGVSYNPSTYFIAKVSPNNYFVNIPKAPYILTVNPTQQSSTKYTVSPPGSEQSQAPYVYGYSGTPTIQYLFNSKGNVAGYQTFSSTGAFTSGANYVNPKSVGIAQGTSPQLVGNALLIPGNEYAALISQQGASQVMATIDKDLINTYSLVGGKYAGKLGSSIGTQLANVNIKYNAFYQAGLAGILYNQGYSSAAIQTFTKSLILGNEYALAIAGGIGLAGGTTALGSATPTILAVRFATGAAIGTGLGEASSYTSTGKFMGTSATIADILLSGSTGVIAGASDTTLVSTGFQAAKYTAISVGRDYVLPFAGFSFASSAALGFLYPSLWSGTGSGSPTTQHNNPQQPSQLLLGKTQQSANPYVLSNLPQYLSFVGKSTISGGAFGAEYGGTISAVGSVAGAAIKTISPGLSSIIESNPLISRSVMSASNAGITYGVGTATGQPMRYLVPEVAISAAIPFTGSIKDFFNTAPRGTPVETSDIIVQQRSFMDRLPKGDIISEAQEPGTIQKGTYGSIEFRTQLPTIEYKNAIVETSATGIVRTITSTSAQEEQTLFLGGTADITQTITSSSTFRNLFGLKPKVTTTTYTENMNEGLASILTDKPLTVIAQKGVLDKSPDVKDIFTTKGLLGSGKTTILTQSMQTPQGEEWLGKTGDTQDFKFVSTKNIILIERAQDQPFLTLDELKAGRIGDLKASVFEGPKAQRPITPFTEGTSVSSDITPAETSAAAPAASDIISNAGTKTAQISKTTLKPQTQIYPYAPAVAPVETQTITMPPIERFSTGTLTSILLPQAQQIKSITGTDPLILSSFSTNTGLPTISTKTALFNRSTITNRQANTFTQTVVNPQAQKAYGSIIQTQTQQQIQQQSQKQTQKEIKELNGGPAAFHPITGLPDILPNLYVPFTKLKPTQINQPAPKFRENVKSLYVSDISHAMLKIYGKKTNIGISRPIQRKREKGKKK